MAYAVVPTKPDGDGKKLTLANWNAHIKANIDYFKAVLAGTDTDKIPASALADGVRPSCRLVEPTSQSIAHNTITVIAFTNETFDATDMHNNIVNPERITATTAGKYLIVGQVSFPAIATGRRQMFLRKGGIATGAYTEPTPSASNDSTEQVADTVELAVNDYVDLCVFQTSGGALNVTLQILSAVRVA